MVKLSCDICVRWLCGILFSVFAFCWLYFLQRDLIAAAITDLFPSDSVFSAWMSRHHLVVSLFLTAVALLLAVPGRMLLSFRKGLYACNYLFSALFLAVITGYDGDSLLGQTYAEWIVAVLFMLILFLVCRVVASVPKSSYNDRPRTLAGNLLIMSLLFCFTGWLGNTDENLHRRLRLEYLYSVGNYKDLLEVGRFEEESDASIDLIRAKAMLSLSANPNPAGSGIGELLFRYSISDPKVLAGKLSKIDNPHAYLSACLLNCNIGTFRDSIHLEDYRTLPTYYMQALVMANDSRASTGFPQQYKEEKELYDAFLKELEPLKSNPLQFQANSTFINYHETYFWFYTFRK